MEKFDYKFDEESKEIAEGLIKQVIIKPWKYGMVALAVQGGMMLTKHLANKYISDFVKDARQLGNRVKHSAEE